MGGRGGDGRENFFEKVPALMPRSSQMRTGSLNALVRNAGLECSCGAGIDAESVQAKGFPCALVIMSSTFCPRRKSDDAVGITAALTLTNDVGFMDQEFQVHFPNNGDR